ncbi:uncharacterized isomerase BH0283-like [Panicum virgatum]|uniref:uncharacterized isomerase BH0283-like n=1 Tax=Panicum virgatum TaxID=38727 RepID=UPI0019D5CEB0|nr:uncharacterized isomerase BH0283-like [Panicum virgatum]
MGNPATVCLLNAATDERWMQAAAVEFNLSKTTFPLRDDGGSLSPAAAPLFQLKLFTPTIELCPADLFRFVLVEHDAAVEFVTKSGVFIAKKVPAATGVSGEGKRFIELDPMIDFVAILPSCPRSPRPSTELPLQRSQIRGR